MEVAFLREAVTVLAAAVGVVLVCARVRVPAVVGLLLTGLLIGPGGLGWVGDTERVAIFAELGVAFLLFAIGAELRLSELKELGRPFLLGGSGQCALTGALGAAVALALGQPPATAIFLGLALCLSSTAVVLKLYEARRETGTPQGRISLAVLLFQDLLVVPIVVLTPLLAAGPSLSAVGPLVGRLLLAVLVLLVLSLVARYLMPPVLDLIVRSRVRELFVLGAVTLCLALSWMTGALGFSLALGAFLAGLLVAETEYSHQVLADVVPFRDLFASVFFISVGMLVDVAFAVEHLPELVALALLVIAGKAIATAVALRLIRYPIRIAVLVGLGLAQIGEFSFVVMEVGRRVGLLGAEQFQALLVTAVLTLVLTPLLVGAAPRLGRWAADLAPGDPSGRSAAERLEGHVIVIGFGMNGRMLSRVLRQTGIPYVVVELNPTAVAEAHREEVPVLFGDATRNAILESAGVERARVAVFAISDPVATRRSVRLARELNPALHILVRTRQVDQIEAFRRDGADQVVAEEFESAIEIFTRVLAQYHVPRNVVRAQTRVLRAEGYQMLRAEPIGRQVPEAVLDALAAGTTDLYRVTADGGLAGRTLRQLDLRRAAGATVIAVVRGEESFPNPAPDVSLAAGDCLVLVGSHEEIDRAFAYLDGTPKE
ncbi:MAG: cation:proton antiporter [Thermoanaerobaculia bacterium]